MSIDQNIVLWVNGHNTAFLDELMWFISMPTTWIPLYVLLLCLLVFKVKDKSAILKILIGFAVAVALSDYICSGVIKPLFQWPRPSHDSTMPALHKVHGYVGGEFGFCSSHAANSMAVALLFSLLYRKTIATVLLMIWVLVVCYSRIYLGAHYPIDIIAGLIIGSLFAVLVWLVLSIVYRVDEEELRKGDS